VYFYTFHKCASSLFSSYVLRNIEGLRHVDYANQIYCGKKIKNLIFHEKAFVYGPIRLSARPVSPEYQMLVQPATEYQFIRDRIGIFFLRDPRSIIVSSYFSFGYTHGLSPVAEFRARQEESRRMIQSKTIDQYALDAAGGALSNFDRLQELSKVCKRSVVLKYEDMIDNWDVFVEDLTKYIDIKPAVLAKIYEKSRPRVEEKTDSHRRSGRPDGFREKLKPATIASLNRTFEGVLEQYQYEA
jgi:hypothetical protein